MPITIHDVAREAGVSKSTVSRVFNDNQHVSLDVMKLVKSKAKELGYISSNKGERGRPKKKAIQQTNQYFSLLIPDTDQNATQTPLSHRLNYGLNQFGLENNLQTNIHHLNQDKTLPNSYFNHSVDGVVIRTSTNTPEIIKQLPHIPTVVACENHEIQYHHETDLIQPDNQHLSFLAFQYFNSLNCSEVYAKTPNSLNGIIERVHSLENLCSNSSMSFKKASGNTHEELINLIKINNEKHKKIGIFLPTLDTALYPLLNSLHQLGLSLFKEVYIMTCCTELNVLWSIDPKLSCIDICADHIGYLAGKQLQSRLTSPNQPIQRILTKPILLENQEQGKTKGRIYTSSLQDSII